MPKQEDTRTKAARAQGLCGAKKRNGEPCKNPGTGRGGRCRMHGGASLVGPAHPNFKHGKASVVMNALPARLRRAFEAAYSDPDILSMRTELAVADARLTELLERIDTQESGAAWASVQDHVREIKYLFKMDPIDRDAVGEQLKQLTGIVSGALDDERNWRDLQNAADHRRKLSETERKLVETKQAYVDADRLNIILARLLHVIRKEVEPLDGGRNALTAIVLELRSVVGADDRPVAEELSA